MNQLTEVARLAFIAELRQTPAWNFAKNCDTADFRQAMSAALKAYEIAMIRGLAHT